MNEETLFLIIWFSVTILIFSTFYKRGKKALSIFPSVDSVKVKFRDKSASGYSTKSFKTKIGGTNKLVDIVVTEEELWLKSKLLVAGIGQRYDMLHKVSLDNLTNVKINGKEVIVDFLTDKGEEKQVVLLTKKVDELEKNLKLQ